MKLLHIQQQQQQQQQQRQQQQHQQQEHKQEQKKEEHIHNITKYSSHKQRSRKNIY